MKKMGNKGFALVETLIVAAFVMGILTLIFANYLPMMGKYEQRERYDDIDSVYHTYLIKNMLEYSDTSKLTKPSDGDYVGIDCDIYNDTDYLDYCQNLFSSTKVYSIILTTYNIKSFKDDISKDDISSHVNDSFADYILSLANYNTKKSNPNGYNYRIIVQYKHVVNSENTDDDDALEDNDHIYFSYSTIGVRL